MTILFGRTPDPTATLAALAVALALAWVCAVLVARIVRRILIRSSGPGFDYNAGGVHPVRVVRGTLFLLLALLFVPPVLEAFGQPLRSGLRLKTLVQWGFDEGLHVGLIIILAFLITRLVRATTARFEGVLASATGADAIERAKRARTLSRLVRNSANIFVVAVATLEVLDKFGINIAPILLGGSIVGVALGFGAQTLVKDFIGGFFLILENQVRVGDIVDINGVGGQVEVLNLRTLALRDFRGAVHVIPCGSVVVLTNLTRDYGYAVIDLRVSYSYDTDKVIDIMNGVARDLAKTPPFSAAILEPLEVLGVEMLGEAGVTIRARLKTLPHQRWDVGREMQRRLQKACAAAGIDLSLPSQRTLVVRESRPAAGEPPR